MWPRMPPPPVVTSPVRSVVRHLRACRRYSSTWVRTLAGHLRGLWYEKGSISVNGAAGASSLARMWGATRWCTTGRRDFLCPRCAQRFGRRDHLTRHLKKSHAQDLETLPPMPIKEEPSPTLCSVGSPKDATEAFSMAMFNPQGLPSTSTSGVNHHHHTMASGPLSSPMGVGCYFEPNKPPPQQYHQASRYQPSSTTSYLKVEMENFLTELQCGPMPPQAAVATAVSRPGDFLPDSLGGQSAHFTLRNSAFTSNEPPTTSANMDLSHLLGFLPLGLPPYSTPLGYSTSTNGMSPSPTSQLSGPLTSFPPQSTAWASGFRALKPALWFSLQLYLGSIRPSSNDVARVHYDLPGKRDSSVASLPSSL